MANQYASNFGDVVKHAVLSAAIEHEQPTRYLESHGGRLDYDLPHLTPGRGGAWDLLDAAAHDPSLEATAYVRVLRPLAGSVAVPGSYPGSLAIADALLPEGAEVVAFDLVESSAANVREGLAARRRRATITVGDGLTGTLEAARPGDLVLLDPFHVTDTVGNGPNSIDGFAVLANRGVATLLWYGVFHPDEPLTWPQDLLERVRRSPWRAEFSCPDSDAGLAGCGLLGANLAGATEDAVTVVTHGLAGALGDTIAGLRCAVARSGDATNPIWHPLGVRHTTVGDRP